MQTVSLRLLVLFSTYLDKKTPFTAIECADIAVEKWSPYLTPDDMPRLVSCVHGLSKSGIVIAVGTQESGSPTPRNLYVLTDYGKTLRKEAVTTLTSILDELAETIKRDRALFDAMKKVKKSYLNKNFVKTASIG